MDWTVIKEDENGSIVKALSTPFRLLENSNLDLKKFQILKYLDPYGNTVFNSLMFRDLISDLNLLKTTYLVDKGQVDEIINLTNECINDVHTYLKFYGD